MRARPADLRCPEHPIQGTPGRRAHQAPARVWERAAVPVPVRARMRVRERGLLTCSALNTPSRAPQVDARTRPRMRAAKRERPRVRPADLQFPEHPIQGTPGGHARRILDPVRGNDLGCYTRRLVPHPGDVRQRDNAVAMILVDRLKDMNISGGENICWAELESVIGDHPLVKEIAVAGQTPDLRGFNRGDGRSPSPKLWPPIPERSHRKNSPSGAASNVDGGRTSRMARTREGWALTPR